MNYIKKKIEKRGLIKLKNNNLYLFLNKYKLTIYYNKIKLCIFYKNNINFIKKYLKECGFN